VLERFLLKQLKIGLEASDKVLWRIWNDLSLEGKLRLVRSIRKRKASQALVVR
jgi:hypothetical protein